ncbi:Major intrinsic protein [Dioscorea alata]|uniref:Major intrinsic protein n=1 Tax=Dioscorea alata TaxID=55571 RepID=A0ACB7WHY5_DIOAL|nr:Major intrinsic protein [Dioscorea alata]
MASITHTPFSQCISPIALRSYLAEFLSTFIFVFSAVGSSISARMLTPDATSDSSALIATAVAQGFALSAAVFISGEVSGGHVNPAVTFAMTLGGHIPIPNAVFYWISQMLAATFASLLLRLSSAGQAIPTTRIAADMTGFGGAVLETVTTFTLVYTVYVAFDPRGSTTAKRSSRSAVGPILVGLVAGACVLATGSLTGGSMNPARSFGPAIVSGDLKNQAVYWVGPLIGAALATLVHQYLVYPFSHIESSAGSSVVV